ncbi:acyltransferase, WS/DGAT/MGAT [Solimonas aquatica]|uniref:diacylglycerol O-acyltransferase n=1 Tax=Solimonas aquatica TaxID=489703 RepID=A0A1H9LW79_9GAMM|nr:WS/DGAT domain-containing protein [Solimonas aquatica]SER15467.1 acyltransferase, WS/DGAT/MGAT [Solimonas aquatica]
MTAERTRSLMSSVDRAWLEMDEPHNPMVVAAIFQLDGGDAATLGKTIVQRLLRYPRFRQRADDRRKPPLWIESEAPDLDYHLHLRRLGGDEDADTQLRQAIASELAFSLDRNRPLWRLVVFAQRGAPLTVLFRAHHAMADGIALMHLMMSCTDEAVTRLPHEIAAIERRAHGGPLGGLIDRLIAANRSLELLRRVAHEGLAHPGEALRQLREGRHLLHAVNRLLRLPQNNPQELRRPLRGHRGVAWIDDVPLAAFRARAKALDVKLNDLFMAWTAGALHRYLRSVHHELPENQNLRVSIPVNLRPGDGAELGNYFGLVLLDLPVGVCDPRARLQLVSERMLALKESGEARAVLLSLAAAGHLPLPMEKRLVNQVAGKAAAVVSNLRGPEQPVSIAGHAIRNLVFWPPQSGGIGLGLSLFSYAGHLSLGVCVDQALIANPQRLLQAFRDSLNEDILIATPPQTKRRRRKRAA